MADSLVSRLEALLGPGVVSDSCVSLPVPGRFPEVWVRPHGEEQIGDLLRWASQEGVAVYTRGGGTCWQAAFGCFEGGIGLDLGRLDRVHSLDAENLTATTGAGLTMDVLARDLAAAGLFFPADRLVPSRATVGGTVATGRSGPRHYGYGRIGQQILGCRALFPGGQGGKFGGNQVKNVSGYDIARFLCGSWGSLGVITEVVIRARPLPQESVVAAIHGKLDPLLETLNTVRTQIPQAIAVELLLGEAADGVLETGLAADGSLLVYLEGSEVAVTHLQSEMARIGQKMGIKVSSFLTSADACFRRQEAICSLGTSYAQWNIAASPMALPAVLGEINPKLRPAGVVAHAAAGTAHVWLPATCPSDPPIRELAAVVAAKGGLLFSEDAEAGAICLPEAPGDALASALWHSVKDGLDPSGIMAPAARVGRWGS